MKGTILQAKLIERGKIEVERSYIALDGKNGTWLVDVSPPMMSFAF